MRISDWSSDVCSSDLYLLGWTPGSFDSWNVLYNMQGCIDDAGGRGKFNLGGYCNKKVDELTDKILVETDKAKRDAMIAEAWKITLDDVSYIPLHPTSLAWGMQKNIDLTPRAANVFNWTGVRTNASIGIGERGGRGCAAAPPA